MKLKAGTTSMRVHLKKRYMFIQCRVSGMTSNEIPIIVTDSLFYFYILNGSKSIDLLWPD